MKNLIPSFVILLIVLSIMVFIGISIEEAHEQARNLRSAGMVLVQGGCYEMGDRSGKGDEDERPVHMACIDPFYLGKAEVTVEEFSRFVEETGYQTDGQGLDGCEFWDGERFIKDPQKSWRDPGFSQNERSPVVCVSWNDAGHYIDWIRNKSPKKGMGYRLPTEAEWEFAARNRGTWTQYPWLDGKPFENIADKSLKRRFPGARTWKGYDDRTVFTAPAGSFPPNGLGLYDMDGNVNQWMLDWYGDGFYKKGHKANPRGPSDGTLRVIRGGSWADDPAKLRLSARKKDLPDYRSSNLGFRLALGVSDR